MTGPRDLADFAGRWQLRRRIEDARAGQILRAEGQGLFTPCAGGLIYDETVQLHLPGQAAPVTGSRRYLWDQGGDGVAVRFADGRPFHRIALGRAEVRDRHDCAPDHYAVRYEFGAWPVWTAQWTVRGPRKSYQMTTRFSRCPADV